MRVTEPVRMIDKESFNWLKLRNARVLNVSVDPVISERMGWRNVSGIMAIRAAVKAHSMMVSHITGQGPVVDITADASAGETKLPARLAT